MNKVKKVVPVEVYSRVVGYFRPVHQWNKGKQEEYNDRYEQHFHKLESKLGKNIDIYV